MATETDEPSAADRLRRWEEHGAVWRVASHISGVMTVSLLRCDGGEEVDTVRSDDPDLLAFVGDRTASDE